jgi:hypothetical protein
MSTLRNLTKLSVDNEAYAGVTTLGLRSLTNLRELNLKNCTGVEDLAEFTDLVDLHTLCLQGCSRLRNVHALARLNLRTLALEN